MIHATPPISITFEEPGETTLTSAGDERTTFRNEGLGRFTDESTSLTVEERLNECRFDFENQLSQQRLAFENRTDYLSDFFEAQLRKQQEQIDELVNNQSITSLCNGSWQSNAIPQVGSSSDEARSQAPAKATAEAVTSTGQDGHVVETPAQLRSTSEERAENYPRSTVKDTEDEDDNADTDTHPLGLENPTKTETHTNPINESEARSEIRSIVDEQCGALTWRACYFDMQVNGTSKALNTTPFHANRGSHANDANIGQGDGMDDNIPALSTDIIDRLTGILGKWSSFQFGDLGCEPTADVHHPLDTVYAPIGYSRIPDKLADHNCYFNAVARHIYMET